MAQPYFYIQQCCGNCCSKTPGPPNGPVVQTVAAAQESLQEACNKQANVCTYSPLLRIIITVLTLANANGSTSSEILDYHNTIICPEKPLTLDETDRYIRRGISQGAIIRRNYETGSVCIFSYFADLPSTVTLRRELKANPYYQLCLGVFADKNC